MERSPAALMPRDYPPRMLAMPPRRSADRLVVPPLVVPSAVPAAVAADLPADLAVRVGRRVDVGVRRTRAHRRQQLPELTGRDALPGRPDDVGRHDRAADRAALRRA